MQVSIETTSGLERRLTVGIPASRVDGEVDERLKKAAKNMRLPGFRPGKVPMNVMRQRFGENVRREVVGEVVSQTFQEVVTQEKLRPAGQPNIEAKSLDVGKDIEYVATFEVFPEVEVLEMQGFDVVKPVAQVTEEDIDNIIEVFRKQQGTWQKVERAAALGDQVNIDYSGTRDGEAFSGGSADGAELKLGSGQMIPGFEDGIVGMQPGEEKTLALSFPADYHSEELRGAAVEFSVKLNSVEELVPAAVDEVLFAKYGMEEGSEADFRREVGENMARELKNAITSKVKGQVMDAVLEMHSGVELPKSLIGQEIIALRRQMFQQLGGGAGQNLDLNSLLPDEMFAENAEKRVRLGLVLAEMIKKFGIVAESQRVRTEVEELASTYQDPEEVINWYYSRPENLASVETKVIEDMVVEKLLETANIAEQQCSYQDAVAPVNKEDA